MIPLEDAQHPNLLIGALLEHTDIVVGRIVIGKRADCIVGRAARDAGSRLDFAVQLHYVAGNAQRRRQGIVTANYKLCVTVKAEDGGLYAAALGEQHPLRCIRRRRAGGVRQGGVAAAVVIDDVQLFLRMNWINCFHIVRNIADIRVKKLSNNLKSSLFDRNWPNACYVVDK